MLEEFIENCDRFIRSLDKGDINCFFQGDLEGEVRGEQLQRPEIYYQFWKQRAKWRWLGL